tara:strand:+ start:370 stop:537 length:168 start_codon:yes stop_codon:yes gene_type:complete
MSSKNDITGDKVQTRPTGAMFRDGWERIYGDAPRVDKDQDNAKELKQVPDTKKQL